MSVVDLREMRAEKEGKVTPKAVLTQALELADEVEDVIVVVRLKDGNYNYSNSNIAPHEALGLLEVAKFNMVQNFAREQEGE